MTVVGNATISSSLLLRLEVEDFLYREAELLDSWQLEAWLKLFDDPCEYSIPPTDMPDADPERHTFLVHDDRFLLETTSLLAAHQDCACGMAPLAYKAPCEQCPGE
jgi:Ring hydroxylating beta subunit